MSTRSPTQGDGAAQWFTTPIASCNLCGASWPMPRDEPHDCIVARLTRDRDAYRAAIDRALGLIETASSRSRILQARDVLREALAPSGVEQAASVSHPVSHPVAEAPRDNELDLTNAAFGI